VPESNSEVPASQPLLSAPKPRSWRIIAGPKLRTGQFHAATVPDGPDCKWEDGSYERIEAQNRRLLKTHFAELKVAEEAEIEASGYFVEPEWRAVVSPDGVLCYVTRFRPATTDAQALIERIPADLSIPAFLDRRPSLPLQRAACGPTDIAFASTSPRRAWRFGSC
jgi:hypothetical protein